MLKRQRHTNSGLLEGKLGLVIVGAVALTLIVTFFLLPAIVQLDEPVVSELKSRVPSEADVTQPDAVSATEGAGAVSNEVPPVGQHVKFPTLAIDAEGEAAQLVQAKAAAAAAERFNQQKQNQLNVVLAGDFNELESLAKVEVAYTVKQWRGAWAAGDTSKYLSFYSDDFVPANQKSVSKWLIHRRNRVMPSKAADITLSNFKVSFNRDLNSSDVEFDQHYHSEQYTDHTRKKLVLVKEPLGWKLISEGVLTEGT